MSQLDLEQLELEGEEHLAENQPAPGKATLTSRIGRPQRAGAGDLIDGATAAQLAGGLGVELSRGDGGNGGGGAPRRVGAAVGFLSGGRSDLGSESSGEESEERSVGRGLDFLGGASLRDQQRAVTQFDSPGELYDQRATVDARLTVDAKLHKPFKKKGDEEREGDEHEGDEEKQELGPSARLDAKLHKPFTPGAVAPEGNLRAQQREVVDFDRAVGDTFYDQRATVDVDAARPPVAPPAPPAAEAATPSPRTTALPATPATPAGAAAPEGDLRSQQREVVSFDRAVGDTFYDQRATVDVDAARPPVASAAPPAAETATPSPRTTALPATPATPATPAGAAAPEGDLRSQQREVVSFDRAVGDTFYDQRATVDVDAARPPVAPAAPPAAGTATPSPRTAALPATPATPATPAGAAAPEGDLRSQQREVVSFDRAVGDTFYDQRATVDVDAARPPVAPPPPVAAVAAAEQAANAVITAADPAAAEAKTQAQLDAEKVHEAMHTTAGTAGGAIEAAQAAGVAAQDKASAGAAAGGAGLRPDAVVGMIDPDLKKPQQANKPGEVPLDAIDPDLKKAKRPGKPGEPGEPGEVPLDAIDPALDKKRRGVPLDATNPDLKKPKSPGKPGEVPLDAIDPDLAREKRATGLLDPDEDDPLFEADEFEGFPGDEELKQQGKGGDPDARVPELDGKIAEAKVDPARAKELAKGVAVDATIKKQAIHKGIEAKTTAVKTAGAKGAAGAAAKGGKKVATAVGKGKAAVDQAKGQIIIKKKEKAKNLEELKQRLEKAYQDEKTKLSENLKNQKTQLDEKIKAEKAKVDAEVQKQDAELAKQLKAKNDEINKQIDEKKKAYDKQIAEDRKKAEKTCRDEQKKTRDTTTKEVAKINKQGEAEAKKVLQQGHKDAAAARQRGNAKASAAVAAAGKKASGVEDAAQKANIEAAAQRQAGAARAAANAEAKEIDAAAHAEAAKRRALTKELADKAKAQGDKAVADLDAKLKQSLADLDKKAADGVAKMQAERSKMETDLKAFSTKLKADYAKKNKEAIDNIDKLRVDGETRIKGIEESSGKAITQKHDDMLLKLEKGKAEDLAKLEEETDKICGEITMSVAGAKMAVDKEIKIAQDKAAFEAKKRTDAIAADGKKQLDELDRRSKDVQAQLEKIDADNKNALAKAGEKMTTDLKDQGQKDRDAVTAAADKAVVEVQKTSEQYEADKKAEAEAAAKKKADEEKAKKEAEEKAKAEEQRKKDEAEAKKKQEEEEFKKKSEGAADALFAAMDDKWGTDEAAVFKTLKGKSPKELEAIKAAYFKKTGRTLEAALADEMSGNDLKEAKSLLSQDPVQQAVASLQNAMEGWGTDEAKVKETLAGISDPEVRKKVIQEYEKQTGERLQKVLEDEGMAAEDVKTDDYARPAEEPKGPQRELTEEEKQKGFAAVSELEGAMHRWGTDEAKLFAALKGKSPEELQFIKEQYKKKHGKDLDTVLEDELSGTDLKEARALLTADPVQAAVAQIHNACDGLGTDKEKVISTLKDIKDPAIRKQVQEEYEKQTGVSLKDEIKDEMSGMDADLADALVGEPDGTVKEGKVAAIEADKAMHGGFLTDISDGMADTFGVKREDMRKAVGNAVLPGLGDHMGTDIGGTDEEALYKALESVPPEKRQQLLDEYKARTGRTLDADLKGELTPKEKDVTDAILAGDKVGAEAAKMAAAADGLGTDRKALYAALEGKSKEEREAIIKKFNEKYKDDWPEVTGPDGKKVSPFEAMCKDELDELDQKKAAQIAEAGKMEDGFALYYAMNEGFLGIGTDDAALKEKLKGKSKEEVLALQKSYLKAKAEAEGIKPLPDVDNMKPDDPALQALNNDIAGETSGRTGHELKQSLKGNPTTPEEMLQRAKEDYEFERKDSGWIGEVGMFALMGPIGYAQAKATGVSPADISNGLTDMWSDSGKQLDKDYAELVRQYEEAKKKHENDPKYAGMTPEEKKKAIDQAIMGDLKGSGASAYVEGSIKQFGEAKDATADMAGTVVAVAVGAIITIASGGTAAPALVALISGLAGVSAKMIIKGASMSNEELVQELAQVAAEALAAGFVNLESVEGVIKKVAGKFGNGVAGRIMKEALEEAVESGTEELLLALLDENLYKGDLADFAAGVGGRVGKAALTGAGAAVVSTGFGEIMGGSKKFKEFSEWTGKSGAPHGKAITGAINQAVGAAFTTAIDPNTYNGSGADVALAFGKSMGSAALRGLQDGYSTSEGGFKTGKGWAANAPKSTHSSGGPGHANAKTTTGGTASSPSGNTNVTVNTEVDVKQDPSGTSVDVNAKVDTAVTGADGNQTASDQVHKTLPLDTKSDKATNDNKVDPAKVDPNAKTQPIDTNTLVDTDPTSATSPTSDGKVGTDPNSTQQVDTTAQSQAEVDAAKKAHAGNDLKALDAAVKALPGASGLEVVADTHQGPLAANQVTASDAKKLVVMLDAALKSEIGQDAVKALQDLGITLTMQPGKGSFRQGNRINIDPTMASNPHELAGLLAHEVHHAKTFDKDVDINTTRDQYIESTLRNEAEAQAAMFEHFQQTGQVKGAQNQFGAKQYFAAYDAEAKAFKKANPDATDAQVHAAAKEAGTKALAAEFGNAVPSTSVDKQGKLIPGKPKNYSELYGDFHDKHSPQGKLAQQGQKVDGSNAAPQVTPVENEPRPTDRESLRAFINEKFGHIVNKYIGADHTSSAEFDGLIAELKGMEPGELGKPENKAKSKEILDRWMAIAAQLEAKTGKSEADLRELYNIIEKQQMPVWLEQMKGMSTQEQAEFISKMREELKLYIRDLMTDDKSKEVLYLRDLALYGDRRGPQMDKLVADALKKTNGDLEAAYKLIVESAMRSNKDVNKGITGDESGIKKDGDKKGDKEAKPIIPAPSKTFEEDPGGRGNFLATDQQLSKLDADQRAALDAAQDAFLKHPSEATLDALCDVRERLKLTDGKPGSPEHMRDAWLDTNSELPFDKWVKKYPGAMKANERGRQREKAYENEIKRVLGLDGETDADPTESSPIETNKPVFTESGQKREVDIQITTPTGKVMIQIKGGYESLTTKPKQSGGGKDAAAHSNKKALSIDKKLKAEGAAEKIVWVLEQGGSRQLIVKALQSDVHVVVRVDSQADADTLRDNVVQHAKDKGLTKAQIAELVKNLKIVVETDLNKLVEGVIKDSLPPTMLPEVQAPAPAPMSTPDAQQAAENEQAIKDSQARRDAERAELGVDGLKGKHSGTEVHSHFLGIVENQVFAQKFGGFDNVLKAIAELQNVEDNTAKEKGDARREMSHGLSGSGKVKHRGSAGDALLLAKHTLAQLDAGTHPAQLEVKARLSPSDPSFQAEMDKARERAAEETVAKCLAASDETDFNSAYEIRDALLKQKFAGPKLEGESQDSYENRAYRQLAKETVARLIEDGILLTEQSNSIKKLQQRFPDGLIADVIAEVINEIAEKDPARAEFLSENFDVVFLSMGLNRFYGKQERRMERILSPEEEAKLVDDKGQPLKGEAREAKKRDLEKAALQKGWLTELVNQFGYDRALATLQEELTRIEADMAAGHKDLDGRNSPHRAADLRAYIAEMQRREAEFRQSAEKLKGKKKADGSPGEDASVMRSDIVGIDTAGQELFEFTPEGKERFKLMYLALVKAARDKGEVLVFRPHVGEGAINPERGAQWNAMTNRWEGPDGKPIHYERAANNVEAMVDVLMELKAQGLLDPEAVTIRFGHATHTSPRDAARLASLKADGVHVIAEVNLGSNRATNVVDHATTDPNNPDGPKVAKTEEDFQDHSFLTLLYNEVQIILSTDGHAVEKTTMGEEYDRAHKIIEKFLKGEMTLRLTAEQANGRGREIAPGVWELTVQHLNKTELERFLNGYRQLHAWARQYRETNQRGGAKLPTPTNPAPLPGEEVKTGASSMVPNSSYSGTSHGADNSAEVTAGVVDAMPRIDDHFSNDTVTVTGPSTMQIEVAGNAYQIQVVVVPSTDLAKPTDVANLDIASNPIVIKVSASTDRKHVERALTHEVAEIISRLDERHGGKVRPARDALNHDSPQTVLSHDDMGRIAELRVLMAELNRPGADQDALKKEIRALLVHMGLLRDGGKVLRNDGPAMQRRALIEGEADGIDLQGVANAISLDPPSLPPTNNDGLPLRGEHADPDAVVRKDVTFDEVAAAVPPELITALEKFGLTREIVIKYVMQCHNDRSRQRYLPDLEGLVRKYAGRGLTPADVWIIDLYTTKLFYELLNKRQRDSLDLDTVEDLQKMLNDALAKLPPHPGATIWRSLELPPPVLRNFLTQYKAGEVVNWSAFTSVAADVGGTFWDRPASNILFEIRNGESYDISDFADGIHYSPNPRSGAELFMPGGIQVKVISVTEEPPGSNRWRIVLEQLPRGGAGSGTGTTP